MLRREKDMPRRSIDVRESDRMYQAAHQLLGMNRSSRPIPFEEWLLIMSPSLPRRPNRRETAAHSCGKLQVAHMLDQSSMSTPPFNPRASRNQSTSCEWISYHAHRALLYPAAASHAQVAFASRMSLFLVSHILLSRCCRGLVRRPTSPRRKREAILRSPKIFQTLSTTQFPSALAPHRGLLPRRGVHSLLSVCKAFLEKARCEACALNGTLQLMSFNGTSAATADDMWAYDPLLGQR